MAMNEIRKFKFWCQKVLPLVYDDSLSYYEVLCKVVQKLNEVIKNVDEIPEYINEYIDERLNDEHIRELIIEAIRYLEDAISKDNEEDNTNFSTNYSAGTLIWWNDKFYRVTRDVQAGDTILDSGVNPNVEEISFAELFVEFIGYIKDLFTVNDEGGNSNASKDYEAGEFVWIDDELYETTKSIAEGVAFIFTGDNQNVKSINVDSLIHEIREQIALLNAIVGELDNLTTTDKTSIVNAINELDSDLSIAIVDINDRISEEVEKIDVTPFSNMIDLCYLGSLVGKDSRYPAFSEERDHICIQSMCLSPDGDLVCVRWDESHRDNNGIIEVFNTNGISYGTQYQFPIGHGNSITYANGYYYVGWSYAYPSGVETPSNNVTKIKADFSSYEIITAHAQIPAISYDAESEVFYVFRGGKIYTYADDSFSEASTVVTVDETYYNTSLYPSQERQNGCYWNGYWIEIYLFPAIQCWYDVKTGKLCKVYCYPRRHKLSGFSLYEPEAIVYNPADEYFYSVHFSVCGQGDIATNTFTKWSPFKNANGGNDAKYYQRNGVQIVLYVDPSISDNAYMDGTIGHPYKYIQFAIDLVKANPELTCEISVKCANLYLGTIRAGSTNNWTVLVSTTRDTVETIPSVYLNKCSEVGLFNLNCGSLECVYVANAEISDCVITGTLRLQRTTYSLHSSSCETLILANATGNIYGITYTTITQTGVNGFSQPNMIWCDGGFINVTTAVPAGEYVDFDLTYHSRSMGIPRVCATMNINSANMDTLSKMGVVTLLESETSAKLRVYNNDSYPHACAINWFAYIIHNA